jgi:hypothetical protein
MLLPLSTCLLAVATLWLADGCGAPAQSAPGDSASLAVSDDQSSFTRLLAQNTSGYPEPAELVLRDRAALESAWRTLFAGNQGTPLPAVDFGRSTLVLLALGEKNSGGHAVRVDRVTRKGSTALVQYTVTQPGPGCMTTMMVTSPVELISIPRVAGEVRFARSTVIDRC